MLYLKTLIIVVQLLSALGVIGLVLLQHGKGADMGAAFGGGSSGSLFGASGSANFLSRSTAVLATIFFLTSVGLTYLGSQRGVPQGVMEKGVMERALPAKPSDVPAPKSSEVPAPASSSSNAVPAPASPGSTPVGSGSSEVPK